MSGRPTRGGAAAWAPAALLLVALSVVPLWAASSSLPLGLEDPATGKPVQLTAGAPVLHLVFFATWCPPCVEELERLAELEERWKDRGYRLVLIAVQTRQTAPRLSAFKAERRLPGELRFDAGGVAERSFEAAHLPLHVLLDANGVEIVRAGALGAEVTQSIERALATRAPREGRPR